MLICGIDEAGRGPLAGPVVVSVTVFEEGFRIKGVKDSKLLNDSGKESLFHQIIDKCFEYKISVIDHSKIDEINILQATMLAVYECISSLELKPDIFLMDGNYFKLPYNFHDSINFQTIIDGDQKIFEISCASILAKVTRDNIMRGYHLRFPEYNFYKHKGYCTPEHVMLINEFGESEIHRKTFCAKKKNLFELYKKRYKNYYLNYKKQNASEEPAGTEVHL